MLGISLFGLPVCQCTGHAEMKTVAFKGGSSPGILEARPTASKAMQSLVAKKDDGFGRELSTMKIRKNGLRRHSGFPAGA